MLSILLDRDYARLFAAQVVALLGTGLATVALGLLAYDIAGENAAMVLGVIFTIKMVAYVALAPVASAFAERVQRKRFLVGLDLVRAAATMCIPFVSELWHVYMLVFVLHAASAGFTPAFQATIPDVLPEEDRYTRALSLSRLAYDLESLLSPMLAAFLLIFLSYHALFLGTVAGFLASALLIVAAILPTPQPAAPRGIFDRTTRGIRIYLATPRLRALLALTLTAAASSSLVIVNTVSLVRGDLGLGEADVAIVLSAFGAGSMLIALVLPRILDSVNDRLPMLAGAALTTAALAAFYVTIISFELSWLALIATWFVLGMGYSFILTPSGRLLRRSSHPEDRPSVFAAQFTLSHACWLVTYPLSGWLMSSFSASTAVLVLMLAGFIGLVTAFRIWPEPDAEVVLHRHDNLPLDHPHLAGHRMHEHRYIIDDWHKRWAQ